MRDDPVAARFAENLIAARARSGLSQEELAFRAGLHRTAISYLETGVRVPRIDTVAKLAGSLGIDPAELLAGIAWHPGEFSPGGFADPKGGE